MKINKLTRTIIIALLMAILTTGAAFASEGTEVEVIGSVIAIYPDEFRLEIEVDNEGILEIVSVQVGQNFNFDTIAEGDLIEVKGTLDQDGALVLTELKIQERARDRLQTQDGELDSNYCVNEDDVHPVGSKIADTYGVEYNVIEEYLCGEDKVPLGQIMLAMQTASLSGGDYTEYLDGFDGISWGQVWQELDIKGKPDHGTPPGQLKKQDGEGDPDENIPPGQQKKDGDGLDLGELFEEWMPPGWFKKGKNK